MRKAAYIAAMLNVLAVAQAAGDDSAPPDYEPDRIGQQANLTLPLEQILADISKRWGYSFIFDSRVTKGKQATPIDEFAPPAIALENCLKSANLSVQKINEKTYAIKAAAPRFSPPLEMASAAVASPMLVDAIIVTATAAGPIAVGSPNIVTLDEDALALLNAVAPSEVIYELPQSFSTFTPANTMFLGALSGISLVDLRGLGPQRTLTLVNGRRRTPTPGGNSAVVGVDLNALAEPFMERIEVISAPGGATSGPDAVAGYVNFVTKKFVNGLEAGAQYGLSKRGDAQEASIYAIAGGMFAGIEITAGVNLTSQDGLLGKDRDSTIESWGVDFDGRLTQGFGGSVFTPKGSLTGAVLSSGQVAKFTSAGSRIFLTGNGGYSPFSSPDQLFNPAATQQFIVPSDRALSFLSMSTQASDSIDIFLDGQFAWTRNHSQLAPLPTGRTRGSDSRLGDAIAIDIDNPGVPDEIAALYASEFGGAAESIILERRFVELGPREQTNDRSYIDIAAGAHGDWGAFNAEITYRFGRSSVSNSMFNLLDRDKLEAALDPLACAAFAGCTPVDLFRVSGISARAADFLRAAPARRSVSITEHELRAVANLEIEGVFADTTEISAGLDFRRTTLKDQGLTPTERVIGAFLNDNAGGSLNTFEAFSTINAPLLQESPIGDFDLSLAGRISASSETDPAFNLEVAPAYSPTDGIEFFAQIHVGRRPPNVIELFGAGPALYLSFDDPCDPSFFFPSSTITANCTSGAMAVDAGFMQTALITRSTDVGNPDLRPEKIQSQVYGISIAPTRLADGIPGRMKVSATWLSYQLRNAISQTPYAAEDCYGSPGLSDPACGISPLTGLPLIRRDPLTQQITAIESLFRNGGEYRWRGVDLAFDYMVELDTGFIDRVWINSLHTIALRAERLDIGAVEPWDVLGSVTDPRHVSRISIGGEVGPAAVNVFLQRRSAVEAQSFISPGVQTIPASLLIDLTTRLNIREGVVATFSVENIADSIAPVVATGSVGNTFPEYYDLIGRRFSVGIKGAFWTRLSAPGRKRAVLVCASGSYFFGIVPRRPRRAMIFSEPWRNTA